MTYISPKRRFIEECMVEGCELDDALFLADLEFDANGDVKPGSIYDAYRKPTA
jgi:hypothetical protein